MGLTKQYVVDYNQTVNKTPETKTTSSSTSVSYYDTWEQKRIEAEAEAKLKAETAKRDARIETITSNLVDRIEATISQKLQVDHDLKKDEFETTAFNIAKDICAYHKLSKKLFAAKERNTIKTNVEASLKLHGINLDFEYLADRYCARGYWDFPLEPLARNICEAKVEADLKKDPAKYKAVKHASFWYTENNLLRSQIKLDLESLDTLEDLDLFAMVDQYLVDLRPELFDNDKNFTL